MAAPTDKTTKDLNGKWQLNKTISDDTDPVLQLQGIGFLIRKGVGLASIVLEINQYEAPPKPGNDSTDVFTHIDITQTASGLSSTQEDRCLDNTYRPHSDWLFGNLQGKSHWVTLDEIPDEYLKVGDKGGAWLQEGEGKNLIYSHVENKEKGWTGEQVWGFQIINGERRYVRHVVVRKGNNAAKVRLIYDYQG